MKTLAASSLASLAFLLCLSSTARAAGPANSSDEAQMPGGQDIVIGEDAPPVNAPAANPPVDPNANAFVQVDPPTANPSPQGDPNAVPQGYADTDPSALTDFHGALDPYGNWSEDANYGTVWMPSTSAVGADFAPYVSSGHWTYDTDYTWVSDYSWGWAPFHYGRWVYLDNRGWGWIPGRTYAGAWVNWRVGYNDWGYVGWAPLGPTWCWRNGVAVGVGVVPRASYAFVPNHSIFAPGIAGHIVTGSNVGVIAGHTRPYVNVATGAPGGIAGHVGANPGVGGPSPTHLGLTANQVPNPPANHAGLTQARAFSSPTTATQMGGRLPQQLGGRTGANPSVGGFNASPQSHMGGPQSTTLGRNAPTVSAPQYRGVAPQSHPAPYYGGSHSIGTQPYMPRGGSFAQHTYAPPRSSFSAPHYSGGYAAPHYSAPHYSAPSTSFSHSSGAHFGGGGFHGGGGHVGGGGHHR